MINKWADSKELLCVRLDCMGDLLMMTPALRALKNMPRRITLLTSPGAARITPYIPEIDETIVYAAPWMKSSASCDASVDLALVGQLRERHFDGAVIFTTYSQSPLPAAMLCQLAGIPLRLAHCRENPYLLLTDWVAETEPQSRIRHEVRRQLDLVATIGCRTADESLSLQVAAADKDWARQHLASLGIDPAQSWIVIHPGAAAPSRRYPADSWRCAVQGLAQRLACPLVFTGESDERPLVDTIMRGVPGASNQAGRLDLGKLAALISLAPLIIVNNTGPAHIAAAVGTPVVDLYALTNPQHAPWQVAHRLLFRDVPCRFCYKSICPEGHQHCLSLVPPASVVDAALALLGGADEDATAPTWLPEAGTAHRIANCSP